MSAAEKPPNLEELDPRYPRVLEYLERGWVPLRAYGLRAESTPEQPVCWCKLGAGCPNPGKHPAGTWKDAETGSAYIRSAAELERVLPPRGAWNVALGFGTGALREAAAIDVDSEQARLELLERHGLDVLEASCLQRTGKGWHAVYRVPAERLSELPPTAKLRNGASRFDVPGVDIRYGNGIIIAEPSLHYSDTPYRWERFGELEDAPEAFWSLMQTRGTTPEPVAPERKPSATASVVPASEVIPLHSPEVLEKRRRRAVEEACRKIESAGPGSRNDSVNAHAYGLGIALSHWPASAHAEALEELRRAAEVQTPPGDDDYTARVEGTHDTPSVLEEAFRAGVSKGLGLGIAGTSERGTNAPIPPPGSEPRPKSSSTSSSSSSEEPEKDAFTPRVVLTRLSDLGPPLPVEWVPGSIAEGRLPLGELSIIMGKPGVGKGSIGARIVAELTQAGHAVIVSAPEDDLQRVTLPRYIAAGANLENVYAVAYTEAEGEEGPVNVREHVEALLEVARSVGAVLVLLDPLGEHLSADAKVERENRQALRPLLSGCRELRCAVLGIDHLNRLASGDAYSRAGGSSAKYKLARSVLIAAKEAPSDGSSPAEDTSGPAEVVLVHDKCNVGKLARGLRFGLRTEVVVSEGGAPVETVRAELLGETTLTSAEALGERAQEQASEVAAAAEWLGPYLEQHGGFVRLDDARKAAKAISPDWTAEVLNLACKSKLGGKIGPRHKPGPSPGGDMGYKLPTYIPLGEDRQ